MWLTELSALLTFCNMNAEAILTAVSFHAIKRNTLYYNLFRAYNSGLN